MAVNGAYYKLDVLDGDGAMMAAGRILSGIESIIRAAETDKAPANSYGALTTNITRTSEAIFCGRARQIDKGHRRRDLPARDRQYQRARG